MSRFAELVRTDPVDRVAALCALAAEVAPGTVGDADPAAVVAHLGALAGSVRVLLPASGADDRTAAEALRVALGVRGGFAGFADDHGDVRASLLPEVVTRGRGLPVLLSVVWSEVALRVGVQAHPLGVPGHVVVRVGEVLVDPFHGGREVDLREVRARVDAMGLDWDDDSLAPMDDRTLMLRVLANLRNLGERTDDLLLRARAATLSLAVPGRPLSAAVEAATALDAAGAYDVAGQVWDDVADEVGAAGSGPDAVLTAQARAKAVRSRLS